MRYATVGTSWITEAFITGATAVEGLHLTAVYSRDLEKGADFALKHGAARSFTALEEMAQSDAFDAVYIASPNALHYEQSKLFLSHGKHVLCEKPATVTEEQLAELQTLARERGLVYLEAMVLLHLPQRAPLKKMMESIGRISAARLDYAQLSSKYGAYLEGKMPNIFNPALATGCCMDIGVYCVYAAIDLFGVPERIVSAATSLTTGADACGSSLFVYPDQLVTLTYSKVGQGRAGSEICGDCGTIRTSINDSYENTVRVARDGSETPLVCSPRPHVMGGEALDFYHYVTQPKQYADEYAANTRLAAEVCRAMCEIRRQAGIVFPCERA